MPVTIINTTNGPPSFSIFTQLIRNARHFNEEALIALYQRALPVVYRYVQASMGQTELVEYVVSEVFLVMVETIAEFKGEREADFYAWLLHIARNKIASTTGSQPHEAGRHVSDTWNPPPSATPGSPMGKFANMMRGWV